MSLELAAGIIFSESFTRFYTSDIIAPPCYGSGHRLGILLIYSYYYSLPFYVSEVLASHQFDAEVSAHLSCHQQIVKPSSVHVRVRFRVGVPTSEVVRRMVSRITKWGVVWLKSEIITTTNVDSIMTSVDLIGSNFMNIMLVDIHTDEWTNEWKKLIIQFTYRWWNPRDRHMSVFFGGRSCFLLSIRTVMYWWGRLFHLS